MQEIRLVILGGGGVGKSALVVQFMQNHFIDFYDPTIEDSYRKQVEIDGKFYLLDVLDTSGQEEYSAMRDQYMRTGEGFILAYSIINRQSFNEIIELRDRIIMNKEGKDIPIVLCGNKIDLYYKRQVLYSEGVDLARNFGCPYYETSAKTCMNVNNLWFTVVREIMKRQIQQKKSKEKCMIV